MDAASDARSNPISITLSHLLYMALSSDFGCITPALRYTRQKASVDMKWTCVSHPGAAQQCPGGYRSKAVTSCRGRSVPQHLVRYPLISDAAPTAITRESLSLFLSCTCSFVFSYHEAAWVMSAAQQSMNIYKSTIRTDDWRTI